MPLYKAQAPFITDSRWRVLINSVSSEDLICDSFDVGWVKLRDPRENFMFLYAVELFTGWLSSATRSYAVIAPSKTIVWDTEFTR